MHMNSSYIKNVPKDNYRLISCVDAAAKPAGSGLCLYLRLQQH